MNIERLQKRTDFVNLTQSGRKYVATSFLLQSLAQPLNTTTRLGFTATKKLGGAVMRNRAKRRLRAVSDKLLRLNPNASGPVMDLVLVARYGIFSQPFTELEADIEKAFVSIGYTV